MGTEKYTPPVYPLRVAAVQMESQAGNKDANFAKIEALVEQAAIQSVNLIIFPECCITGYWFIRHLTSQQLENLAEPIPDGVSTQRLKALATKYNLGIGAGLVEKSQTGFYNSYVVAQADGKVNCHRKLQAFEHPLIKSGTEYTVFNTPQGWRLGILICYDNNVNENGRITALLGADVILRLIKPVAVAQEILT